MSGSNEGVERWDLATGERTRICGEAGKYAYGGYSQVAVDASAAA